MARLKEILARLGKLPFLVSLLVGLTLAWEAHNFFRGQAPDPNARRLLVARRALPEGVPIDARSFSYRPEVTAVAQSVDDQDLGLLRGATLAHPLDEGQVLTWPAVLRDEKQPLAAKIPRGKRAYVLPGEHALDAFPGDRVDIHFSPAGDLEPTPASLVAESIVLLDRRGTGEWVLALDPMEIGLLEKVRRKGKLTLSLRNPVDTDASPQAPRRNRPRKAGIIQILGETE